MQALSQHAKVTLSRQIARDLTERIHSGDLGPGEALPSEAQLAGRYGVHRLTIRQAVSELVQQGLVTTGRGRASLVATPPVRYQLDQSTGASLTSSMAEQGLDVRHEVFDVARVAAGDAPLALTATRAVRYGYRRWVDGTPWSMSTTWLAAAVAPRTWDGARPLLDVVAERHGLDIRRATRAFVAVPAGLADAEGLDVPVGAPLLRVTGTSVDQSGRTVAVVCHHTRGDRAEYVVNLIN